MSHAASQHDTETGLINGAIGTVLSISVNHVTVQFDHMSEPYVCAEVMRIRKVCQQASI